MTIYQILSIFAAFGFLVNIVGLIVLVYKYDFPPTVGRGIFFSLITQFVGLITQAYCFMTPRNEWWLKALSVTVCIQGSLLVVDLLFIYSPLKQQSFMSLITWISNGFRDIPAHLKEYAAKGLEFTNKLKGWLSSPTADLITELIPGTVDDAAKAELISFTDLVSKTLEFVKSSGATDAHVELVQNALLQKTQSLTTALQDGNKLQESDYDAVSQKVYSALK